MGQFSNYPAVKNVATGTDTAPDKGKDLYVLANEKLTKPKLTPALPGLYFSLASQLLPQNTVQTEALQICNLNSAPLEITLKHVVSKVLLSPSLYSGACSMVLSFGTLSGLFQVFPLYFSLRNEVLDRTPTDVGNAPTGREPFHRKIAFLGKSIYNSIAFYKIAQTTIGVAAATERLGSVFFSLANGNSIKDPKIVVDLLLSIAQYVFAIGNGATCRVLSKGGLKSALDLFSPTRKISSLYNKLPNMVKHLSKNSGVWGSLGGMLLMSIDLYKKFGLEKFPVMPKPLSTLLCLGLLVGIASVANGVRESWLARANPDGTPSKISTGLSSVVYGFFSVASLCFINPYSQSGLTMLFGIGAAIMVTLRMHNNVMQSHLKDNEKE